jgi:hypothetical protein
MKASLFDKKEHQKNSLYDRLLKKFHEQIIKLVCLQKPRKLSTRPNTFAITLIQVSHTVERHSFLRGKKNLEVEVHQKGGSPL